MQVVNTGKYRKPVTGNIVHRYEIVGTDDEKKAFLASNAALHSKETGEVLVADNGNPLWMTSRFEGSKRDASISDKGNLILADTQATQMAELASQEAKQGNKIMAETYAKMAAELMLEEVKESIAAQKAQVKGVIPTADKDLNP
jgi:hypothetical protein